VGKTNRLLSFDKTRTAQKTKKLGEHIYSKGDLISLNMGGYTNRWTDTDGNTDSKVMS
jgi:hypothetical protein